MTRSPYVTPEGAAALRAELEELWRVQRPRVVEKVREAAALGDRSENAEYLYGKRQLRAIDRRVRHLRKRLEALVVVDRPPEDPSRVYFGATVALSGPDGDLEFRIVGPDELDPARGTVSVDAPLARALLGHRAGDTVRVRTPEGPRSWTIRSVAYRRPQG